MTSHRTQWLKQEVKRAVRYALQYSGPHAEEVCRIAACIATGKPYSIWDEVRI